MVKGPYKKKDRKIVDGTDYKFCRVCTDWFEVSGNHWYIKRSNLCDSCSYYCKTKYFSDSKEWNRNNRDKLRKAARARLQRDPATKMRERMGRSIWRCVKGIRGKSRHLPYTMEELVTDMRSKFKDNMSFDNYGKWHVDHIIPLKAKNKDGSYYWNQEELADPTSQIFKKAWNLDNLQPLWASENHKKKDKILCQ